MILSFEFADQIRMKVNELVLQIVCDYSLPENLHDPSGSYEALYERVHRLSNNLCDLFTRMILVFAVTS